MGRKTESNQMHSVELRVRHSSKMAPLRLKIIPRLHLLYRPGTPTPDFATVLFREVGENDDRKATDGRNRSAWKNELLRLVIEMLLRLVMRQRLVGGEVVEALIHNNPMCG